MARDAVATLHVALTGDISAFAADMDRAAKAVEGFGARVAKSGGIAAFGKSLENVGSKITSAGTALSAISVPIAGFAGAALKAAADFESAMNGVRAKTELTQDQFRSLQQAALQLGAKTKYSATEAAQGMEQLAAAGLDTDKILAAIPGTLDLAAAGQVSVARAAEITVSALGQFGLEATQASHVADLFAAGADAGALKLEDLADSMKYVGPIFKDAGYSIENTTAAVALLSNAGIKASEAGTALRAGLLNIQNPSKAAANAMKDLGVNVFDATGKLKPFNDIIKEFAKAGATSRELSQIVGKEGVAAWASLTNFVRDNGNALSDIEKQMSAVDGAAQRKAQTLNSGLRGAFEQLGGSINTAGIAIGNVFAPAMIKLAEVAASATSRVVAFGTWFTTLPQNVQLAASAIVGLGAAIGPVVVGFGLLVSAVGALASPLALALSGVTVLGSAIIGMVATNEKARAAIGAAWETIRGSVAGAVEYIVGALPAVGQAVGDAWQSVKDFASGTIDAIAEMTAGLRSALPSWEEVMTALSGVVEWAMKDIGQHLTLVEQNWGETSQIIKNIVAATRDTIRDIFDGIGAIIDANVSAIQNWSKGWKDVADVVVGYAKYMYQGIKEWLGDKLSSVVSTVRDQVQKVAEAFRWLLDDVITHSSIPDLVKGVEKHIGSLDEKMVRKTKKQTEEVANRYRGLRDNIRDTFLDLTGTVEPSIAKLANTISGLVKKGDIAKVEELGRSFAKTKDQSADFKDALEVAKDELQKVAKAAEETAEQVDKNMKALATAIKPAGDEMTPLAQKFQELLEAGRTSDLENIGRAMGTTAEHAGNFRDALKEAADKLKEVNDFKPSQLGAGLGAVLSGIFGDGANSIGQVLGDVLGGAGFGESFKEQFGREWGSFDWGAMASAASQAVAAFNDPKLSKQDKALTAHHAIGRGVLNAFFPGAGEAVTAVRQMFPELDKLDLGTILIKSLTGENAQTTARKEVERWIEKAIEGAQFYNAQSQLSTGFTNIIRGASDTFNAADWPTMFQGMGDAAFSTFNGIGMALQGLLGVTEDIGPQIGFMLAQSFGGNLDDARVLVQELGFSLEEMTGALFDMAAQGKMSWHEYNVAVQGVTNAYADGRAAVADYRGAFDHLIASGGRGMIAVKDFKDIAVEALEGGFNTMQELKAKLIAEGADPAQVEALFQAAAQRGIKTLEGWKQASKEVAGAIVGDMYALDQSLAAKWDGMKDTLEDVSKTLKNIPDKIEKSVTFKVRVDDQSGILSGATNLKVEGDQIKTAAVGAVVSRPTGFAFRGGRGLMGEAGPEAILPLTRVGGRLGVAATMPEGGGTRSVVYNIDARGAAPGVTEDIKRAIAASHDSAVTSAINTMARVQRQGAYR